MIIVYHTWYLAKTTYLHYQHNHKVPADNQKSEGRGGKFVILIENRRAARKKRLSYFEVIRVNGIILRLLVKKDEKRESCQNDEQKQQHATNPKQNFKK